MTSSGRAGDLRVRWMQPADAERVAAIARNLNDAPHWGQGVYEAALRPGAVPERVCLVAAAEDEPVGFLVAALVAGQAEIESIAVAVEHQKRGIGRALLAMTMRELRSRGVVEVFLEVRASNEAARGLYASAGFVEYGRRPRYYADPVEDAILLRTHPDP